MIRLGALLRAVIDPTVAERLSLSLPPRQR